MVGTLGLALAMFWPQIVRIATDQGEIVIESNDPDVQIEVISNGGKIKIVDLKTNQSIEVQSGNYQIRALGGDNAVVVDKESLTLSRGETEIVKVTKIEPPQKTAPDNTSEVAQVSNPLHDSTNNFTKQQVISNPEPAEATSMVDPAHVVGPGDVLGVFVEDVTGQLDDLMKGDRDYVGMPTPVRSDGTISLPAIKPVKVEGMTIIEIEDAVRKRYVGPILKNANAHISVAVLRVYQGNRTARLKEPVYNGMTYDQCLDAIKYERDGTELNKPCIGMMALRSAEDSTEVIPLLLEAVLRSRKVNAGVDARRTFARWLTDKQLCEMALEFTKSDSADRWRMFNSEFVGQWSRLRGIEDELSANLIDVLEKQAAGHISAARSITQLVDTKSIPERNEAELLTSLIRYAETSPQSYLWFSSVARFAPEWEGLGKAMRKPILESSADQIRGWAMMVREIGPKNQEEVIEVLATRILQVGDATASDVILSLRVSLLEKIRPIYESYLAKGSDAAIYLKRYMKKKDEAEEKIRLMEHRR